MTRRTLGPLTPLDRALEKIIQQTRVELREKELETIKAQSHVTSQAIKAPQGVPPWPKAGLDGYAVRSSETPGRLKKINLPPHRDPQEPPPRLPPGHAAYVATGAYLPQEADALAPLEIVVDEGSHVSVPRLDRWRNIDPPSSLVGSGEILLEEGSLLTPPRIAGLLEAGIDRVWVWERLRVAYAVAGALPAGGSGHTVGLPRDTTGPLLSWLLRKLPWVEPEFLGAYGEPLEAALAVAHRVLGGGLHVGILVGKVGPGVDDVFEQVLMETKGSLIVRGVALKGSRPFTVLSLGGRPLLWMPGAPTSALTSFLALVLPLLEHWGRVSLSWRESVFRRVVVEESSILGDRMVGFVKLKGSCRASPLSRGFQRSSSVVSFGLADGVVFREQGVPWESGAWFLGFGS